jgi:hypothetical protein
VAEYCFKSVLAISSTSWETGDGNSHGVLSHHMIPALRVAEEHSPSEGSEIGYYRAFIGYSAEGQSWNEASMKCEPGLR